ncbi:L,D-transpeptidase catalytic domain-containing protein [Bifidobacterium pseudolongum subsp. globosum]|uniref:L,D-transpeptidase catalytic domain-containing protein n=1 Tax=Bifidobacterium pseudolongum subsp. globosum TaxID=1690 RepID=A0A4Q5BCG3_9BIFI|nr:L,D-transpeptidase family protein [Bifidobacterium pseudolongum]RYQ68282.1 L,D-transpeptidase catalytic domain-containing protein [Bifidobacterium pseudolongum subsp. globosum]
MSLHDGNQPLPQGGGTTPNGPVHRTEGERTQAFTPLPSVEPIDGFNATAAPAAPGKRHHVWPWIVLAVVVLLVAAGFGAFVFFQDRALPGTTLWGHDVVGKTQQQIATMIDDQVNTTKVPVAYGDKTAEVSAKDLGVNVDAQAIAHDAVDAKRNDPVWDRYAFWDKKDVAPSIDVAQADPTVLDEHLGTNSVKPVNAELTVNEDSGEVEVTPAANGSGADPTEAAEAAVAAIESFGATKPQTVTVELKDIEPQVTDAVAMQAKQTVDELVANKVGVSVGDHEIAQFTAPMLIASSRIEPDTEAALDENEARNGVLVFSADKLQQQYDETIKGSLTSTKEDREVIVNGNGTETEVIKEGHDGVKIKDGADASIGVDALPVLTEGKGTVKVAGEVDPMKVKQIKRHVVVDLSDHKVYAYQDDKLVKSFSMSAGQGNDYATGACNPSGDMCTPLGDFEIWLKYPTQDMSGTLTLSDGKKETWDVKGVGFVNYFSKSGCAIHRIATSSPYSDAQIAAMGANTSHGCVGIGWDVAEWFYDFAGMGTSVHVQQ